MTDAVEKVVNDLTKPFRWSIFGPVFVSAGVSELNARPTALGWTPLTLRRRMQLGCPAMAARYSWRVSSSSARWRQGGIRRVHRKGPATAYARMRGALQVRKTHLDLLALVAGFGELGCTHQGARRIPCVLMHVPWDLSEAHVRSALGLELT